MIKQLSKYKQTFLLLFILELIIAFATYMNLQHNVNTEFWIQQSLNLILILIIIFTLLYHKQKNYDLLITGEFKYINIIENIKDHYIFYSHDINGVITDVSNSITDVLGYTKEEFMEHFATYLTDDPINDLIEEFTNKTMNGGDAQQPYVISMYHKNGTIKYIELSESLLHDPNGEFISLNGVARDITHNYLLSQELEELKERMELALLGNHDGLWDWDLRTNKIYFSPRWKEMLGYNDEELPNEFSSWEENVHPDDKEEAKSLFQENIEGKTDYYEGTHRLRHKNGSWIWILDRGKTIFDDGGKALRMIGTHTDITAEKEMRSLLKKKDEMLIKQSRHAAMGEMINMIAHQWRQPISTIAMSANNMLVDIALDDFNITESKKYANSITEHTQHLSKTIDDFRNFFKPDNDISEVNIRETVDTTLSIINDTLKNNNIRLTSSYETDKTVKAYPRELMQVFVNIINNSKDALILNKKDNASISIRVYEDEKYINTEICDNGSGIDVDVLPKIFDPYFSTKNDKNGTGLGLYMSKMIIESHLNGIIEVHNNDEGACFTIRLLKEL